MDPVYKNEKIYCYGQCSNQIKSIFEMNDNFVIEEKWNYSVGFIRVDNTVKLVRHYEYRTERFCQGAGMEIRELTYDIYENGMVKCYERYTFTGISNVHEKFTINITDGEKLDDTYIDRIEFIFKPHFERLPGSISFAYPLSSKDCELNAIWQSGRRVCMNTHFGKGDEYFCQGLREWTDKFDWNNPDHVKEWVYYNGPLYLEETPMSKYTQKLNSINNPDCRLEFMQMHVMDGLNALKAQYKAEQDKLTQLKHSYELKIQQLQNEIQQLTKNTTTTKHSETDVQKTIDEITTTIYDLIYDSDNNSDSTVEYQEVDDLLDLSFSESCGDQTTKQNLCGIKAIERYEKQQSKYGLKNKRANINMTFQDNNKISPIWI